VPFDVSDRLKVLERENRELRQVNEILRKASAYFAMAELDRRCRRSVCREVCILLTGSRKPETAFNRSKIDTVLTWPEL
jgi:hypothetical protein